MNPHGSQKTTIVLSLISEHTSRKGVGRLSRKPTGQAQLDDPTSPVAETLKKLQVASDEENVLGHRPLLLEFMKN